LINGAELGVETKRQIVFMPTYDFLFGWMKVKQVIILAEKKFGGFLSLMVFLLLGWLIGKITEFIFFVFFKLGLLVESSFNFILKPFKAERVQSAIDKIIG